MSKVQLPERVLDQIEEVVRGANGTVVGGLLIGWPTDRGFWVERILACRNAAPEAFRDRAFAVEPGALANVRRTLATTPSDVLGFFSGGGALLPGEPAWLAEPSAHAALSLAPTSNGHGRTPPRIWLGLPGEPEKELAVELIHPRETLLPFCPE